MANLNDDGDGGRDGVIERKIDRSGWDQGQGLFGRSLGRFRCRHYEQLGRSLTTRHGHVTSFTEVPRRSTHLQARFARGGRKNDHPSQQ